MANSISCVRNRRFGIFLLPLFLVLGACGLFSAPPSFPPPQVRQTPHEARVAPGRIEEAISYSADAYPLHLSLAHLTLEARPAQPATVAADLDIVRSYSRQPAEAVRQPVIVLDYALKGQSRHERVVIPFAMPPESSDFPALEEAMTRLNALSYILYEIKIGALDLSSVSPLPDEGGDAWTADRMIEERLQELAKSASPLPRMQQAKIDLQLTRFFMRHHYREPSYLAIEDAKQSLAHAEGDAAASQALSRDIEAQESLLHQTMPFTLNF